MCPEVAVNGKFLPGKSIFFVKLSEKFKLFGHLPLKIKFSFVKLSEKSKFLGNLPGKIEFFYPDTRPPDYKPD